MTWTPTNTFSNGTTADADKVNQNFSGAGAYVPGPRVATLPTTGLVADMEVAWQTTLMKSYGVTWTMKYNPGATYPWECVGGEYMQTWSNGSGYVNGGGGAFGPLSQLSANNIQDLPIPYAGRWQAIANASYVENTNTSNANYMAMQATRIGVEGYDPSFATLFYGAYNGSTGALGTGLHKIRDIVCNANDAIGLRYCCGQNQAKYTGVSLWLKPTCVRTS